MNRVFGGFLRFPFLALLLFGMSGCAGVGLGTIADVLGGVGGVGGQQLQGEVQDVDSRRQAIYVRTDSRQGVWVRYDSRTEVVYEQQRYPVTALERGDYVAMRVQRSSRGEYYTDYIQVQQSVSSGRGDVYEDEYTSRFEGRVGWVDYQRGQFELRTRRGTYTVTLPYNPHYTVRQRFERLRQGDSVRIEGTNRERNRIELHRFY